jgi:ribosomal protein S18 acetylase RimI-like enzyme
MKERHRHRGIGGLLLEEVLGFAARHTDEVELTVTSTNGSALRFFEGYGFRMCGLFPGGLRLEREMPRLTLLLLAFYEDGLTEVISQVCRPAQQYRVAVSVRLTFKVLW